MIEFVAGAAVLSWILGGWVSSSLKQQRSITDAWRHAADRLGIELSRSGRWMGGRIDGHRVEVEVQTKVRRRDSQSIRVNYTHYTLTFAEPLPVAIEIRRESLRSGLAHMIGLHDIQTGDARFDSLARLTGDGGVEILRYLGPDRRRQVSSFLEAEADARIDRESIRVEHLGYERATARMVETVGSMVTLATALVAASDSVDRRRQRDRPPPTETATKAAPDVASDRETGEAAVVPDAIETSLPDWMSEQGVSIDAEVES